MPEPTAICLDRPAVPVEVEPGGEIILRGSLQSKYDGSTVDAATTTWPAETPGGASVDSGGLIDFVGGGFHVTSRNTATHEVRAVATGEGAPVCAELGVAAPCLPLRLLTQSRTRLMTMKDWRDSLTGGSAAGKGCLSLEVPSHLLPTVAPSTVPYLQTGAAVLGIAAVAGLAWVIQRRRAASPTGQILALARRVRTKLREADSVLAAPLTPAIEAALRALQQQRVDASSAEGKRVMEVLRRVDAELDTSAAKARAEQEQKAADELVLEMESALEAADEASSIGHRVER